GAPHPLPGPARPGGALRPRYPRPPAPPAGGPGQPHADVGPPPAGRRSVAAAGQCGAWPWPVRRVAVASTGGTIRVAAVTAGPGTGCPERAWWARARVLSTVKQAVSA